MPSTQEPKRLVTSVNRACHALDCGRDQLYELLNSRQIESFLVGRSRKIVVASIDAYVEQRLKASKKFERARFPARDASP